MSYNGRAKISDFGLSRSVANPTHRWPTGATVSARRPNTAVRFRRIETSCARLDRHTRTHARAIGRTRPWMDRRGGCDGLQLRSEDARTFVGTAVYMSPERMLGQAYSFTSDIWSLGPHRKSQPDCAHRTAAVCCRKTPGLGPSKLRRVHILRPGQRCAAMWPWPCGDGRGRRNLHIARRAGASRMLHGPPAVRARPCAILLRSLRQRHRENAAGAAALLRGVQVGAPAWADWALWRTNTAAA
jgi:hypothetical protein